jgi:hypothetical protein
MYEYYSSGKPCSLVKICRRFVETYFLHIGLLCSSWLFGFRPWSAYVFPNYQLISIELHCVTFQKILKPLHMCCLQCIHVWRPSGWDVCVTATWKALFPAPWFESAQSVTCETVMTVFRMRLISCELSIRVETRTTGCLINCVVPSPSKITVSMPSRVIW